MIFYGQTPTKFTFKLNLYQNMVFVPQFSSNLPKFMEILKFCALWDHVINFTHYAAICPGVFAKLNSNRNNRNNTLLSNHSLLSVTGVFAKLVNNRNNTLVNAYQKKRILPQFVPLYRLYFTVKLL